jgi:2-polyprenyl-3-methyl-5-hydroxy-6-metoxy-1,4-benzoquinol methylase
MSLGAPRRNGVVDAAYANPRPEVVALVPIDRHRVLDVGCSTGHMAAALRYRGHQVVGVEVDPELAREARERLDDVVEADVEELARVGADLGQRFDCIVFADVLEHLRDPWMVVRWAHGQLADDGVIVVAVPNVAHVQTLWALLVRRRWPYRAVGIFDRTHLRFFTRRNLPDLFAGTDLEIVQLERVRRVRDHLGSRLNRLAPLLGELGTYQYVVRAERRS